MFSGTIVSRGDDILSISPLENIILGEKHLKRTKLEKETSINFNEAEEIASIYTFNADLKRRLAAFIQKCPELWLERTMSQGGVAYVMDKSRLSFRLIPPYSETRLAAASAYTKEHGFQVLFNALSA